MTDPENPFTRTDGRLHAQRLTDMAARIEENLARAIDKACPEGRLRHAMRHGALGGGKRIRPALVIETARLFGREDEGVDTAALALECVHCYSLVHDDLPAMDDDALRRGQPTVHKAYDPATAILAGDALLTLAFDLLTPEQIDPDPALRLALIAELARASGAAGMVGGQMLDLASEGRFTAQGLPLSRTRAEIEAMQQLKTGQLLLCALRFGAVLGGATAQDRARLETYGQAIGLAFQIADDLLDVEATSDETGKATAKDQQAGKATLVSLLGRDAARSALYQTVAIAIDALAPYGARADWLVWLAQFIAKRRK